jgi:hypothetical protein
MLPSWERRGVIRWRGRVAEPVQLSSLWGRVMVEGGYDKADALDP